MFGQFNAGVTNVAGIPNFLCGVMGAVIFMRSGLARTANAAIVVPLTGNSGSPYGDPGSVPPQPGFYRLNSPEKIGFHPGHLRGEALRFFTRIEHDLVVDLDRKS